MPINFKKLEPLLDAIAQLTGAFDDPTSDAYQLRNPLLIKSWSIPGRHDVDKEGRRIFDSFLAGYRANLYDLQIKVEGKSRAGLAVDDTINNLLRVYGLAHLGGQEQIISFLRKACNEPQLKSDIPLSWFSTK